MTEKTKERLTNIMIGYFTALILLSTALAFHHKETDQQKAWGHMRLALLDTAILGTFIWKKEHSK